VYWADTLLPVFLSKDELENRQSMADCRMKSQMGISGSRQNDGVMIPWFCMMAWDG